MGDLSNKEKISLSFVDNAKQSKTRINSNKDVLSSLIFEYSESKKLFQKLDSYFSKTNNYIFEQHRKEYERLISKLSILEELIGEENVTGGAK
jgi:hypothetical protein